MLERELVLGNTNIIDTHRNHDIMKSLDRYEVISNSNELSHPNKLILFDRPYGIVHSLCSGHSRIAKFSIARPIGYRNQIVSVQFSLLAAWAQLRYRGSWLTRTTCAADNVAAVIKISIR